MPSFAEGIMLYAYAECSPTIIGRLAMLWRLRFERCAGAYRRTLVDGGTPIVIVFFVKRLAEELYWFSGLGIDDRFRVYCPRNRS